MNIPLTKVMKKNLKKTTFIYTLVLVNPKNAMS